MKLKLPISLAALSATLFAVACSQTTRQEHEAILEYRTGNYRAAADMLKGDIGKKDENFVLNNCRYGSCALAAGDYAAAEESFLNAYDVMDGFGSNDPGRSMGAALVFEGIKVWKGEPFERAMAHYYLGVLYLMKNDYGNARAAFENSLFKVREYSDDKDLDKSTPVESPFAMGYIGKGICNLRMGKTDLAQECFKEAIKYNPGLASMVNDLQKPGVNTFVFVDSGFGPTKNSKGWYKERTIFQPTVQQAGPIPPVSVYADGRSVINPVAQYWTLDTVAMAQERRWQDIDTIKEFKAVLGTGMMAGGAAMAGVGADRNDKGLMLAGIGTAVAGAAVSASSQSDVRNWEMLPRTSYLVPLALPAGQHEIMAQMPGGRGAVNAPVVPGRDTVLYFRMR